MLDIFKQYATDPQAEQDGREFPFGEGVYLCIARANNARYTHMLNARFQQFKHELDKKNTPEEIAAGRARSDKIMAEVMAHTVLLGWRGPLGFKGQLVGDYSVQKAQDLLQYPEFQNAVAAKASEFRNFLYEVEAADAKNSETTSGGTSPGVAS